MRTTRAIVIGLITALLSTAAPSAESPQILHLGTQPTQLLAAKVSVGDLMRSYEFYTQVLGLREVDFPGLPKAVLHDRDAAYADVKLNFSGSPADPFITLMKYKDVSPSREHAKLTWIAVKVVDARETATRVKGAGRPVKLEPKSFMGGVIGLVEDPDGYVVEIVEAPSVEEGLTKADQKGSK